MSRSRRIAISMPPYLLDEVDVLVAQERNTRSDLIRQATAMYLRERKKQRIRELLQQGYQEMAVINLHLADEAFAAEAEAERIAQRLVSGV
ncbi:CopG family ribbon-helix-helix protein [Sulfoacidibacillus ferrooxidans]